MSTDLLAVVAGARGGSEALRAAGEALRAEAERRARTLEPGVEAAFAAIEPEVRKVRGLTPWWHWAVGTALHLRGRPAEALPHFERAYRSFRTAGAPLEAARVALLMVDALACVGRHRAAVTRGRWALQVFRRAGDTVRAAAMLVNLGGVEESRDRIRSAMELWRQASRLLPEDDRLRRGLLEANMAAGAMELGRFAEAERRYREAAGLLEKAGAPGSALQPRLGLAELEALRGQLVGAAAAAEAVRSAAVAAGDRNLELEASVLVASIEWKMGRLASAVEVAEAAERLAVELGRRRDAALLAAVRALALVEDGAPGAGEAVARAMERMEAAGTAVLRVRFLVDLASAGWRVPPQELRQASETLERAGLHAPAALALLLAARGLSAPEAAAVCRRVLGRRALPLWIRMEAHRMAGVLAGFGDPERAYRHFLQAVTIAETIRGRLPVSTDREIFSRRVIPLAEDAVRVLAAREEPVWGRRARRILARLASAELVEEIARQVESVENGDRTRRWRALRQELRALLELGEGRAPRGVRSARGAVSAGTLRHRMHTIEMELVRLVPVRKGMETGRRVEGARFLRAGEVAVEIAPAGPDLFLFLHGPGLFRHLRIAGGRTAVRRLTGRIDRRMARLDHGRRWLEGAGPALAGELDQLLERVGETILGPVAPWLGEARRLFVVPYGDLFDLPWPALSVRGASLIERLEVAVLPGLDLLARRGSGSVRRGEGFGIAGGPGDGLAEIGPEVRELTAVVSGAQAVERATVADALELLGSCDAVHFSAHGAFRHDWAMASGIRLTDGWLTAAELTGRPVRARLVTAGACDVGRSGTDRGLELRGFLRALLSSGVACSVLATGPVDDGVTRAMSVAFYRNLEGSDPGRAFRAALLEVRERHPNPALWGGWRLLGDPGTWEAR